MWRLVLTVSLLCWSSEGSVTCRDENGGEVDWYILYKAPEVKNKLTGLEYLYIYPHVSQNTKKVAYRRNNKLIDDPNGVLANTLRPLFTNPMGQNFGFISYNDQPPKGSVGHTFGHSKGIVMMDKTSTGVWLLHSTPQFPYKREEKCFFPLSAIRNAQTFICVTFPYDQFQHIGKHLQYIRAFPFDSRIPADFYKELQDVVNKVTVPPSSDFQVLRSKGGQVFRSIAKQQLKKEKGQQAKKLKTDPIVDEGGDLYITILNKVKANVVNVQSWGCQKDRVNSSISDKVKNIECIKTTDFGAWEPTRDHSKWCVSTDQNKPWTCIADVNRAESQFERRGGALCIEDVEITKTFTEFIGTVKDCAVKTKMEVDSDSDSDSVSDCDSN